MAFERGFRRVRILVGSAMGLGALVCSADVILVSWVLPSYLLRAPRICKALGLIWCAGTYLILLGALSWVIEWVVEGYFRNRPDPT
jgi:hypothetical protein